MKKKTVVVILTAALTAIPVAICTSRAVAQYKKEYDPNDISLRVKKMSEGDIVNIIDDMTDEEFFAYLELVKDKDQLKRVVEAKTRLDELKRLEEEYEDMDDLK